MDPTYSPRHHDIDGNARKRAKLSPDSDDVSIIAYEPEDVTPGPAIVIDADGYSDMADSHHDSPSASSASIFVIVLLSQYRRRLSETQFSLDSSDANVLLAYLEKHTDATSSALLDHFSHRPQEPIHGVLALINDVIRPSIREKHPGGLPKEFHRFVADTGADAIEACAVELDHDPAGCYSLYQKYVQGEHDQLLTHDLDNVAGLEEVCDGGPAIRSALLASAYRLQADMEYILSSIMNVRQTGINLMCAHLLGIFRDFVLQDDVTDWRHPVSRYAVRFLKENHMVEYIFGPESHADIIANSHNIIAFLAAASSLDDDELDAMWKTCTTSVEADFVKASFACLQHACNHLGLKSLEHLALHFTDTPVEQLLDNSAAQCLERIFIRVHENLKYKHVDDREDDQLSICCTAMAILQRLQSAHDATVMLQRLAHAQIEIARYYPSRVRLRIYDFCLPPLLERTADATTSATVLAILLRSTKTPEEAGAVLRKFPLDAAVAEFKHFVEDAGSRPDLHDYGLGLCTRIGVVVLLHDFAAEEDVDQHADALFDLMLGEAAPNNHFRNIAWRELINHVQAEDKCSPCAERLLCRYVGTTLPVMPAEYATPVMIEIMTEALKSEIRATLASNPEADPLGRPLWKALVRFAVHAPANDATKAAADAVCKLLFYWPLQSDDRATPARCHKRFVEDFVDWLCVTYMNDPNPDDPERSMGFQQAINVLTLVLKCSRRTQPTAQLVAPMNSVPLPGTDSTPNAKMLCFTVQMCSTQTHPTITSVRARPDNTLQELVDALPEKSGVTGKKIIIAGMPFDLRTSGKRTLSEIGVRSSGSILIYPTYSFDTTLENVLTELGPVEETMCRRSDRLEAFLDCSTNFAFCAYQFLEQLLPAASTRARICSADATHEELFPPGRPMRAAHSATVLSGTLRAYAQLGVADGEFITRSTRLLAAYVIDPVREDDASALGQLSTVLVEFLQGQCGRGLILLRPIVNADLVAERPKTMATSSYFVDANAFSTRMSDLLLRLLQRASSTQTSLARVYCPDLVLTLYKAVLLASSVDEAVWTTFALQPGFADLHASLWLHENVVVSRRSIGDADNFCHGEGVPKSASDDYWRAVADIIPLALRKDVPKAIFFDFAAKVLRNNDALPVAEDKLREFSATLMKIISTYRHTECPEYPVADEATLGLLKLLSNAIIVLKSLKKPLGLGSIGAKLLESHLLPALQPDAAPLLSEGSRATAYDIVIATCESPSDYAKLASIAETATHCLNDNVNDAYPSRDQWNRAHDVSAGLTNLSMTCYMNALLQQLYANVSFRKFVIDVPVEDPTKQQLFSVLQELFALMQDSSLLWISTQKLAAVLGTNAGQQEDVHYFYARLLTVLDEELPDEESKKRLSSFFTGKIISQIKGECGHVSSQTEEFTDVSITVKNKATLEDGLSTYVQGEPMQGANKYRCTSCSGDEGGRLVNAMKRTCLEQTPDNVTCCLKRFTFESIDTQQAKVNDRFEFPVMLDLARYQRKNLDAVHIRPEPDMFDLVGVVVHQGSLDFGHYWSYVRLRNAAEPAAWMRIEDNTARRCDSMNQVLAECYGGLYTPKGTERTDNAYMLFYQRRTRRLADLKLLIHSRISLTLLPDMLPRIATPARISDGVHAHTAWRWRASQLCSQQFANFVEWLIRGSWTHHLSRTAFAEEVKLETPTKADCHDRRQLLTDVTKLTARYVLRVLLRDFDSAPKTASLISTLEKRDVPNGWRDPFVEKLLGYMADDNEFLAAIWASRRPYFRREMSRFLATHLKRWNADNLNALPRELVPVVSKITQAHESVNLDHIYSVWAEWFDFLSTGQLTRASFEGGVWNRVFEILYIAANAPEVRDQYPNILMVMKKGALDLTPLYSFLFTFLDRHGDLVYSGDTDKDYRGPDGLVRLSRRNIELLYRNNPAADDQNCNWWLLDIALQHVDIPPDTVLVEYAPGKLYGLLVKNAPNGLDMRLIDALIDRFAIEQYKLLPLLAIMLNYCRALGNQCRRLLKIISKDLNDWRDPYGPQILRFGHEVIKIARAAAIEAMGEWLPHFLMCNKKSLREGAWELLVEHMFVEPLPLIRETAPRLILSRVLATHFVPFLRTSYHTGARRMTLVTVFRVMRRTSLWLAQLHEEMRQHLEREEEEEVLPQVLNEILVVEYEESKSIRIRIDEVLEELKDWSMLATAVTDGEVQEVEEAVNLPLLDEGVVSGLPGVDYSEDEMLNSGNDSDGEPFLPEVDEDSGTVIVTGANRGIGHAICTLILQRPDLGPLRLYAASRAGQKLNLIPTKPQEQQILYPKLDIADSGSIAAFADEVQRQGKEDGGVVDVLINNAGVNLDNEYGFENARRTLEVNYRGTLEMCQTFLPLLSPTGRIVNLSSVASSLKPYSSQIQARFRNPRNSLGDLDRLATEYLSTVQNGEEEKAGFGPPGRSYSVSKGLVNGFTALLARQAGEGQSINCCCPGWIATDMGRLVGSKTVQPPKTAEEGARIPVRLAFGDMGGVTGRYWANGSIRGKGEGEVQEW
ncbi:hypothetical protein LTR62_002949 [Meristemomyces frigidus]|uniref:USP domain-containing protein n=1 Tax=Meristemomyces frigidus TaxID=1508187 RepID=A0AAN7TQ22_9PEZI|nr:hypothetical protein LTR62_002949 [Meristemomyces frigidus]